jgi:hypothetical protein
MEHYEWMRPNRGVGSLLLLDPLELPLTREPGFTSRGNQLSHESYLRQTSGSGKEGRSKMEWLEVEDWDMPRRLLEEGWEAGATRALSMRDLLLDKLPPSRAARRRPVRADQGDEVDMHRVWNGDLDHAWHTTQRLYTYAPRPITLDIMAGGNAGRNGEQLFWSGVAGLVLTDVLEEHNFRVQLNICYSMRSNADYKDAHITRICVKEANEPLRLDSVASIAAHVGVFRYYGIASFCKPSFDIGYAMGRTEDGIEVLEEAAKQGHIFAPDFWIPGVYSEQQALNTLRDATIKLLCLEEDA